MLKEITKKEFMRDLRRCSPKNKKIKKGEFYNSVIVIDKHANKIHLITEFFNGDRQFYKKIRK